MNYIKSSHPKRYIIVDEFTDKLIGIYTNKYVAKIVLKSLTVADKFGTYCIYHDNSDITFEEMSKNYSGNNI